MAEEDTTPEPEFDMAAYEAIMAGYEKELEAIPIGSSDAELSLTKPADPKIVKANNDRLIAAAKEGQNEYIRTFMQIAGTLGRAALASQTGGVSKLVTG